MPAKILDGKLVAEAIKHELVDEIAQLQYKPKLAVVLVGKDDASEIYVSKKCEACAELGIGSEVHRFEEEASEYIMPELKIRQKILELNADAEVNGILIQLPLPKHFNGNFLFDIMDPMKDVDVFHPYNVGLLVQNRPRFLPPTPHGVCQILARNNLPLQGKHVVVINRSNVVGKPLSSMLIQDNGLYANATVTVCHDQTPANELKRICLSADIIAVAVGIPGFLTPDMVKEDQIVIDIGITRIGKKIVGDVGAGVKEKVSHITLVPGGVGPCTVAMLLYNTVLAARLQYEQSKAIRDAIK